MGFGQVSKILTFLALSGLALSQSESTTNARSTRTLASFFGRGNKEQPQQQQQQVVEPREHQQSVVYPYERPLVYQVKYYDTPFVRDVGKNNIDKAGEVRQEQVQVGQQKVYFYTNPVVYSEEVVQYQTPQPVVQQPVPQQVVSASGVPQGYIYVNPVVGGGQPQAYVVSQVGNQQVLVPCPVDYGYNSPPVDKVVPVVPVVKPGVVQPVDPLVYKSKEQQPVVQQGKRPTGAGVNVGGVVLPEQYVYGQYGSYNYPSYVGGYGQYGQYGSGGYGQYGSYGYVNPYVSSYVNPYVNVNYGYESPQVVVGVVPNPQVAQQPNNNVKVQGQTPSNVNVNPYLYYYRGGVPYDNVGAYSVPYSYPYVVPVNGAVPKQPHVHHHPAVVDGVPSNRVSVSGQGQQVQPQQVQGVNQQAQQQAEAKKGSEK